MHDLIEAIETERAGLLDVYSVLHCLERTLTYGSDVGPESVVASLACELLSESMERLDLLLMATRRM